MTPIVIGALGDEPVSVEEARAHVEAQPYFDSDVDVTDDAMIEGWIGAAREHCENFLGLSLSTRTLEIALDEFPTRTALQPLGMLGVDLPMGPVRQVLAVSWGDESDNEMTDADLVLDRYRRPNRVVPVADAWPSLTRATNGIKVRYLAGYGVDSDGGEPLPRAIRAAILLMVGHWFKNREDSAETAMVSIPNGAEALLRPLRVRLGMA